MEIDPNGSLQEMIEACESSERAKRVSERDCEREGEARARRVGERIE
jgi:hypothetical protein